MLARRLSHVSFAVRDLERAMRFYRDLLGLEPIPRPDFGFPGAWLAAGDAQGGLDLYPTQDSAVLTSTAWADGLVDNPPNHAIAKGERVRYLPFAELYW